jgi:hypothetical protein
MDTRFLTMTKQISCMVTILKILNKSEFVSYMVETLHTFKK